MATSSSDGGRRAGVRAVLEDVLPSGGKGDQRALLGGTAQNVVGLVVTALATFGANVLIARTQGPAALGIVTLTTQAAFVLAAGARFGMDMAAVRRVAIEVGRGERTKVRAIVRNAAIVCAAASAVIAVAVLLASPALAKAFAEGQGSARNAFRAAAFGLPFAALVQVYLGGTRGLKIMRHTLFVFWMGHPLAWIALMTLGWLVISPPAGSARGVEVAVLAYSAAWVIATVIAALAWRRETRGFGSEAAGPGETRSLLRYGLPRAPASLLAQGLFYADLYVLARFASPAEYGVYAAVVRVGQLLMLFLVSVNLMFGPFVADLHARGEREHLDRLFKLVTRWVLAATIPLLVLLLIAPGAVLRVFDEAAFSGEAGRTALIVLALGQLVNVATGSVGFVLIMVGRTGWDLVVYAASVGLDVAVAMVLVPRMGIEGAATAGALTLAASNLLRLWLVWRFVRIQPFTRAHLRLLPPALGCAAAAWAAHLWARGAGWQVDLIATGLASVIVYGIVLLAVGLPDGERRAARRLLRAAMGRA